ncbi:hypothetical protein [Nocardia wallacei]|uniref:hypothetical protein n=1 Tax=Nocardia wallacei TaxID=480035 RepID=UPI002455DB6A|nr:hypothetical protein [Nocardia wallacei]
MTRIVVGAIAAGVVFGSGQAAATGVPLEPAPVAPARNSEQPTLEVGLADSGSSNSFSSCDLPLGIGC